MLDRGLAVETRVNVKVAAADQQALDGVEIAPERALCGDEGQNQRSAAGRFDGREVALEEKERGFCRLCRIMAEAAGRVGGNPDQRGQASRHFCSS